MQQVRFGVSKRKICFGTFHPPPVASKKELLYYGGQVDAQQGKVPWPGPELVAILSPPNKKHTTRSLGVWFFPTYLGLSKIILPTCWPSFHSNICVISFGDAAPALIVVFGSHRFVQAI